MENNSPDLNDNMIYNDNYKNYEDLACCNNTIISTFFQENATNLLNYINDLCFNNVQIDDEAQIINDPKQKVKTPLCSQKEKNNNSQNEENNNINNYINNNINNNNNNNVNNNIYNSFNLLNSNNINIDNNNLNNNNNFNNNSNNNNHSLNHSLSSEVINPSNDSAAEPILTQSKYNNMVNQSKNKKKNKSYIVQKNKTNLFNVIKDIFKDLFSDNEEKGNNDEEIKLKNSPILKKIIEKDNSSSIQNQTPQAIGRNNNTILRHANTHFIERPQLFEEDILSFNISEDNEDINLKKLVSFIPVFTVKEKNKSKDNNKCTICLSYFEIGEKKANLPCLHSFHYNCIKRWMKSKKYCPICKFRISLETLKSSLEQNYK